MADGFDGNGWLRQRGQEPEPAPGDDAVSGDEAEMVVLDIFGRAVVPPETAGAEAEDVAPALEAVCFALNRPLLLGEAAELIGRGTRVVGEAATVLAAQLRGRGLMLQRHGDQLQLVTRPEVAWAVQRALNPERPSRLSRAAMETLAIVAYRQPVTRAVLESIRGVNCEAVLEHLEHRGLVAEIGRQETPGHPRLFGTTLRFLQIVGLESIDELPELPEGATLPQGLEHSPEDG
ncbi:MAG TPA: SMC-Scp complex subunit ScpB [Candidatus Dormibacteraeota bacterium]